MANKIGNVTQRRFDDLVDQTRDMVQTMTSLQFAVGDMALEIQPIRHAHTGHDDGIYAALRVFADEIGEVFDTVRTWRYIAAAWPKDQRRADASYTVHRVMAYRPDRFTLIGQPPPDRRGRRHWTEAAAAKAIGRVSTASADAQSADQVPAEPMSATAQVRKIREMAPDDAVASAVAAEFLSRPNIAGRVMADPNTRRQLYQAQRDHDQQVQQAARERTPAIKHVEHSIHFLDLMSAGHAFVTGIKRLMPQIQADPLARGEREVIGHVLDQAQAAIDFCRSVIDTGDLTMDEQLAKLLNEEEP
ncbi:DUF6192 family protein [Streptosporangium roseum]|uniref:DUF6192 family protein n=1 Tax=Streptosporangium roseum TaxID=2001 RepID=UPI0033220761